MQSQHEQQCPKEIQYKSDFVFPFLIPLINHILFVVDQSISNLSRIQISNVQQTLRFKYADADKLPQLMEDIKDEIRKACPELIDDGTRPFRCFWTDYGHTGLEVSVNANFRIKLLGDAYYENRQNMLIAIRKAVKKNKMEFAVLDEETIERLYDTMRGD